MFVSIGFHNRNIMALLKVPTLENVPVASFEFP